MIPVAPITERDILISARQETVQMRHYFLGVEHVFIALLQIQGGLTTSILQTQGLTADYVVDAIRRKTGRGTPQRMWPGIPYTPRLDVVLDIARQIAADNQVTEPGERELLCAILDERNSLPIRVLNALGADIDQLAQDARTFTLTSLAQPPDISVTFGTEFDPHEIISHEQLFILRRMFSSCAQIRIERRLTGFRKALIVVVTPIREDWEDAPVVAKIDLADNILDEVQRYDAHIRHALPLQAARLEDPPTAPEASELAGIKYTLVSSSGLNPTDLRGWVRINGVGGLETFIKNKLYNTFSKFWWRQNKQFRFQVWTEYDWLLPPIVVLDYLPENQATDNALELRIPFNRARVKNRLKALKYGDVVVLENFTVHKVERDEGILKLALGFGSEADKRAYRVDVRGMQQARQSFYRGEVIERLAGRVWKTRHELLLEAVQELDPPFDLRARWIAVGDMTLPNPLLYYENLLDKQITGSLSKIHGDLHLGNILVGPNNTSWLIDFGHTRDGHTLFDWASFEVSLLGDALMIFSDGTWESAYRILTQIAHLNDENDVHSEDAHIRAALDAITAVREIAQECMADRTRPTEYYIALALCALRAVTWRTMSIGGRRLLLLLSGLAMRLDTFVPEGLDETPPPDEIDITGSLLGFDLGSVPSTSDSPSSTPGSRQGGIRRISSAAPDSET